jgi:hypothetical protein
MPSEPTSQEILFVRVPCRDANRRVWQAIEVLRRQHRDSATGSLSPSVREKPTALKRRARG